MSVVDSHENLIFSDYSLNSNVDSAVELNKTPGASPTKLAEFVSKMADSQPSSNAEGFHKFQSKKTKETIGNLMFESTQVSFNCFKHSLVIYYFLMAFFLKD